MKPVSTVHVSLQPSPSKMLPSSHTSGDAIDPSPHGPVQVGSPALLVVPIGQLVQEIAPPLEYVLAKHCWQVEAPADEL